MYLSLLIVRQANIGVSNRRNNMQVASGTVNKVIAKNGLNYLTLVGDDGIYSTYKTPPSCKSGDMVEFTFTQKGQYKNADPSTIKVTGQGATSSASTTSRYNNASSNKQAWQPDPGRQVSIELQSARRDAIDLVKFMAEQGAIKLPTKQADKYDAIMGLLEHTTKEIYGWVKEHDKFLSNSTTVVNPDESSEE